MIQSNDSYMVFVFRIETNYYKVKINTQCRYSVKYIIDYLSWLYLIFYITFIYDFINNIIDIIYLYYMHILYIHTYII